MQVVTEKLPNVRACCHPTAKNKVINFICMNTHTLSHTVRLSFCGHVCATAVEMAAGQTTCVLERGGSGP